jgi:nucleotide-binding universal stress UspA family protein
MEHFPKRILLATDGSDDVSAATRVAVDLANRSGAELDVVHAFEFIPPRQYVSVALRLRSPLKSIEQGRKVLAEQVDRIEQMGGTVADARLLMGKPVEQILYAAEESDAGLVVVGRRGLGGVRRLLMSSVSEGVARRAGCPVLVVFGDGEIWPPARVVVADDLSEDARKAGELATGIGGLFGAEGVLVQVHPRDTGDNGRSKPLGSKIVDHVLEEAEAELRDRAEELSALLGRRPDVKLVVGKSAEGVDGVALTLLGEARGSEAPSLISVGSRGLDAVRRSRTGSVSTKVLRTTECPVLVYPQACVKPNGTHVG